MDDNQSPAHCNVCDKDFRNLAGLNIHSAKIHHTNRNISLNTTNDLVNVTTDNNLTENNKF